MFSSDQELDRGDDVVRHVIPEPAPPARQIHQPRIRVRHVGRAIQASDDENYDESTSLHINPPEPPVPARQPQPPVPARQPPVPARQPPVPARQPQSFNYNDLLHAQGEEKRLVDMAKYGQPLEGNAARDLQVAIHQQRAVVARLEEQRRAVAADPQQRQQLERQQLEHHQREERQRAQQRAVEQREQKREQKQQPPRRGYDDNYYKGLDEIIRLEQQEREVAAKERLQREQQQREQKQREQKQPDIEAKVVLSTIEDKINHFQKKHQECQLSMNEQNTLLKEIVDQTNNEQEDRNDKETCKVCLVNKRSHVVLPCGHYCLCKVCAEEINKTTRQCPICRTEDVSFKKLYENKYLKYKMKYLKLKK